jgi:aerobic-type carbon monoxide dehydrogenase small subunit (CoxS/CutS family)
MNPTDLSAHGKPGVSRRAFLKGSGAAAAATALVNGPGLVAEETKPNVVSVGLNSITLDVNGKQQKVEVEPRTTLLEALRLGLNLTGAKPISVDGSSGGSTVLLGGKPVSANSILALECVGKPIVTVEGLGGNSTAISGEIAVGAIDPICKAFVNHDASQCGFCTPGFVMAVKAFLAKNPKATEAQIREGLNGNLCRCGTYANVIPAVVDVVKGARDGS